jgi:hypothetical protein
MSALPGLNPPIRKLPSAATSDVPLVLLACEFEADLTPAVILNEPNLAKAFLFVSLSGKTKPLMLKPRMALSSISVTSRSTRSKTIGSL